MTHEPPADQGPFVQGGYQAPPPAPTPHQSPVAPAATQVPPPAPGYAQHPGYAPQGPVPPGQVPPGAMAPGMPTFHGQMLPGMPTAPMGSIPINPARGYVGFWARFGAGCIDMLVLLIPNLIIGSIIPIVGSTVLVWLYYALMHSSSRQATIGQSALGMVITDENGQRIGFGKATGQYFATIISGFILFIGYFMIGWDSKKQGLHDKMAGTLHFYKA